MTSDETKPLPGYVILVRVGKRGAGYVGPDGVSVSYEHDAWRCRTAEEIGEAILQHYQRCLKQGMENPRYQLDITSTP